MLFSLVKFKLTGMYGQIYRFIKYIILENCTSGIQIFSWDCLTCGCIFGFTYPANVVDRVGGLATGAAFLVVLLQKMRVVLLYLGLAFTRVNQGDVQAVHYASGKMG